jgi:hypothetical protein
MQLRFFSFLTLYHVPVTGKLSIVDMPSRGLTVSPYRPEPAIALYLRVNRKAEPRAAEAPGQR